MEIFDSSSGSGRFGSGVRFMTLLNWLPEILLILQFVLMVGLSGFRVATSSFWIGLVMTLSFGGAIYYGAREDLLFFDSPIQHLYSDSVSRFFRLMGLVVAGMGAWQFGSKRGLSMDAKFRAILGTLAGGFFLSLASMSAHGLGVWIGVVGCLLSGTHLLLLESDSSLHWVLRYRRIGVALLFLVIPFFVLYFISAVSFTTGSLTIFFSQIQSLSFLQQASIGFFVVSIGFWMIHGFHVGGVAPSALPFYYLYVFGVAFLVWVRVVVPYFSQLSWIPKEMAQIFLGLLISSAALRYAWVSARTQDFARWSSYTLPALFSLAFFPLLLPTPLSTQIGFSLLIGVFMATQLLGRAFWGGAGRNPGFSVVAVLAGVGFPPLALGYQYFRVLRELHQHELVLLAVLFLISWFLISVAAVQMITKLLRPEQVDLDTARGSGRWEDWAFLSAMVLCVILMTAFGEDFIQRLNTQSIPNLW